MAEPMTLIFEIYQDGTLIRTERFTDSVIKIGSHNRSHLFIEDPNVSRVHAYVEVSNGEVNLIDLGSGRGTFVNGEKINKRALQHNDEIQVGTTRILFMTRDERAIAAAIEAERLRKAQEAVQDELLYSRRFLSRPASTDGSVEIALLFNDHVIDEKLFRPPVDVTVGRAMECVFLAEHPSFGDSFTLVRANDGKPSLHFTAQMEGDLYIGTSRYTLAEAIAQGVARAEGTTYGVALDAQTRARIQVGDLVFFIHQTTQPVAAFPMPFTLGPSLAMFAVSGLIHLAFLGVVHFGMFGADGLQFDRFGANDRFAQLLMQDELEEQEEPEPIENEEEDDSDQQDQTQGEAAAGDEGRAGDETVEEVDRRMAIEGNNDPNTPPELARQAALDAVQDRGALAVLNQAGPASLFGDVASGYDPVTAFGGVSGADIGASYGTGGLGRYGGGLGGGGRSFGGGFGAGPIAVRGRASGDNTIGREQLRVADRQVQQVAVTLGNAEVQGQLDREIIQRVVREHRREIRACYEAELQRNPSLEGRVSIGWVISPSGTVAAAQVENSTLNSSAVEQCMTRRILQWRFPEPRGGGIVRVNYPFVLSPGG